MNISNNLQKVVGDFAKIADNAQEATKDEELCNQIQKLSKEIMQCSIDQQNSVVSCSEIIKKASHLFRISKPELNNLSRTEMSNQLTTLSKLANSVILDKMLEEKTNATWISNFFKFTDQVRSELINNPNVLQRLSNAIQELGPNYLLNPEEGITLFIRLAFDSNPEVRKLTLDLLNHNDLNLNHTLKNGSTALHGVAENNDKNLVAAFLARGANPLLSNKDGQIPFDFAYTPKCCSLFLKYIPMETLINEKPFALRALRWVCNESFLHDKFDFTPFAEYLKKSADNKTLNYITKKWNVDFVIGLLKCGFLINELPEEKFKELCSTCIYDEHTDALRTILLSRRLPFDDIANTDFFSAIESNNTLATTLKNELQEAKNSLGNDVLRAYQSLAQSLVIAGDPNRRALKMDIIDHEFQVLVKNNVPGAEKAQADFNAKDLNQTQRENLAKARQIFDLAESVDKKVRTAITAGADIYGILMQLAWIENDNELLNEIVRYTSHIGLSQKFDRFGEEMQTMNKVIANVALDKMYFAEKDAYNGGKQSWVAPYFAHALNITQSKLKENIDPNLSKTLNPAEPILKQCYTEILQQTRWTALHGSELEIEIGIESNRLLQSKELVNVINSLPEKQSCLIPVSVPGHATLIRVENSGGGKARVIYYNTGQGVGKYHPEGKKENTFQTFIEYREVPIKNLQDPEKWTTFIDSKLSDMPPVYALLEELCTGGIKQPPSPHEEDYEAVQKSGSCAYQCFLAMIRERLMSNFSNPKEGLGLYKAVKGIMLNVFEERTRAFRNEIINTYLQSKLKVVGAELGVANALAEPSKRENLLNELSAALKNHNLDAITEEIGVYEKAPSLTLFTAVRKAIKELTVFDVSLMNDGPAKQAIMARQEKEALNKQGYIDILNGHLKNQTPESNEDWIAVFATQYQGGTFQSTAIDWAINSFKKVPDGPNDKDPGAVLLNCLLQRINEQDVAKKERLLSPLLQGFQKAGNDEMISYLKTTCLNAEKKQGSLSSGFEY